MIESEVRYRMDAAALRVIEPLRDIITNVYVANRFHVQATLEARQNALSGKPSRIALNQLVRQSTEASPSILSTYVTAEINEFDNKDSRYQNNIKAGSSLTGRLSPYWVHDTAGQVSFIQEGENVIIDETPQLAHPLNWWYTCPKNYRKVCVVDPYVYEGVLMTSLAEKHGNGAQAK